MKKIIEHFIFTIASWILALLLYLILSQIIDAKEEIVGRLDSINNSLNKSLEITVEYEDKN